MHNGKDSHYWVKKDHTNEILIWYLQDQSNTSHTPHLCTWQHPQTAQNLQKKKEKLDIYDETIQLKNSKSIRREATFQARLRKLCTYLVILGKGVVTSRWGTIYNSNLQSRYPHKHLHSPTSTRSDVSQITMYKNLPNGKAVNHLSERNL